MNKHEGHAIAAIDPEVVSRIHDRLIQTLTDILLESERGTLPFECILEALIEIFTFEMSFTCPYCRKRLAHQLKRRIPSMLTEANTMAAERAASGGFPQDHTCH